MMTIHLHHQVLPVQARQAIPYPTQTILIHLHHRLLHLLQAAAAPNHLIHPAQAQALAQVLNQLTAAKNTTNQNHLP